MVPRSLAAQGATKNSSLSFGLNGISDWSTQHPFIDIMKSARPWIGHLPNQWGGVEFDTLLAEEMLDADGWPRVVPPNVTKLESLVLTDQPEEATHLTGLYHLTFEGRGTLSVTGRGRVIKRAPGLRVFTYTPGPGAVGVAIRDTDVEDPIRNIRLVKEDHLDLFRAGALFNPDWLDRLGVVDTVRFMDWMNTNNSPVRTWQDLPTPSDFTYAWRGVPLSTMISLANQLEADPWFTLPHLADEVLVREFAKSVFADLDPDRTAYVEYSNEVWNFIFDQARWAQQQAEARWGDTSDGWMQYYGLRAAEIMQIWTDVFGSEAETRLKRVVGVHTGWPELEQATLYGDRAVMALGHAPASRFDAYAVTGYFGYETGELGALDSVLDRAEARALSAGKTEGLSRVALREYVSDHRFDGVDDPVADMVRQGSLQELIQTLWPYHKDAADAAGLELVMYEGGTHAAPLGSAVENERLVAFLIAFNYSEQMAALYAEALTAWATLADSPFNAFVDVAAPSQWGSWGALRHLNDDNPRWNALRSVGAR